MVLKTLYKDGKPLTIGRMVCPECEIEAEEILDTFIEEV